jgi:hypothetical protein
MGVCPEFPAMCAQTGGISTFRVEFADAVLQRKHGIKISSTPDMVDQISTSPVG